MKILTVGEAQGQLSRLIAEANQGASIVLTDGEKRVWLEAQKPRDLEKHNPEVEGELLAALDGPFTQYSRQEMQSLAERIVQEF